MCLVLTESGTFLAQKSRVCALPSAGRGGCWELGPGPLSPSPSAAASYTSFRSKKLIQESDQHLKDVEKILQNDKRYLVLDCVPEERRKLIVSYVDDLDRRGPPPPPTASEPTRRTTK